MSTPSKVTVPPVTGTRPRMARPIVVLPEPDSPTTPTVSLGATRMETPSTARNGERRRPREYTTDRSSSSRSVEASTPGVSTPEATS